MKMASGVPERYNTSISPGDQGTPRRDFFRLMAASLALGGAGACTRQPRETILPYARSPEEAIPGRPLFFATAMTLGGYATGLLVESHEGRPTKTEGNPLHPASRGGTDVFARSTVRLSEEVGYR